jgi:hypothetical protein
MLLVPALALVASMLAAHGSQPGDPCTNMHGRITTGEGSHTTYVINDDDHCLTVDILGTATFSDDDADVATLSPNGSFVATERRGGTTRTLTLTERGGRIEREFRVNGEVRPNAESTDWFRAIVLDLVRETGAGAEARVARIRRQGGTRAVLDEVERLRADHVRRIYLEQLLRYDLTSDDARRIAQVAGTRIGSDYDRAAVLRAVTETRGSDAAVAAAVVSAASTMGSDHDRSGVLRLVLDRGAADDATVARALDAAAGMGSDYDRAQVLLSAVDRGQPTTPAARAAFFRVVDRIGSDYDRRRVLVAVAGRDTLPADVARAVLASAARIGSDYDKSTVLLAVAARPERLRDPATRSAFDAALKTIGSDSDYRRVARVLEK